MHQQRSMLVACRVSVRLESCQEQQTTTHHKGNNGPSSHEPLQDTTNRTKSSKRQSQPRIRIQLLTNWNKRKRPYRQSSQWRRLPFASIPRVWRPHRPLKISEVGVEHSSRMDPVVVASDIPPTMVLRVSTLPNIPEVVLAERQWTAVLPIPVVEEEGLIDETLLLPLETHP